MLLKEKGKEECGRRKCLKEEQGFGVDKTVWQAQTFAGRRKATSKAVLYPPYCAAAHANLLLQINQ